MHFQFVGAVLLGLSLSPAPKTSHSVLIPGLFFRPKPELSAIFDKEFNSALFLVTHNDLAASFCDRVVTLRDGRIVREQQPNAALAGSRA
jgi:hypothetical protein